MWLLLGAFVAGMLTVLAPCVLPLLPVIIGGSLGGDTDDRRRPLIIAGSLAVSLFLFTLLLKASTLFINLPPAAIVAFSGVIIVLLGIATLFPDLYTRLSVATGFERRSQKLLGKGFERRQKLIGPIITGAALGPVFSSCSPVYAYIVATVLPVNFGTAIVYIIAYILGLSLILLVISYFGQRAIRRFRFAADPKGWFQRTLGVLFILVGLLIATGAAPNVQTYVSEHTPFDFDALTAGFLPSDGPKVDKRELFNVEPYDAPELRGLQDWINSQPQTMEQLRGKVVLVDFWTYSCINCIRSVPNVESWYEHYKDSGFVVLGIHAPEFSFEKVPDNVRKAVKEYGLTYPIALDNNLSTWNAFRNQYWPAEYLIDAKGVVRRVHFGEGEYDQMEQAIRELLRENGSTVPEKSVSGDGGAVPMTRQQTPETYLGSERANSYAGQPALGFGGTTAFTMPSGLAASQWALAGTWEVRADKIIARGGSSLKINVSAKEVYIVGGSPTPGAVGVKLNGQPISPTGLAGSDVVSSTVTIGDSKLYRLVKFPAFTSGAQLELTVPDGVELNVFTFGS